MSKKVEDAPEFEPACNVAGHSDSGMERSLSVSPRSFWKKSNLKTPLFYWKDNVTLH